MNLTVRKLKIILVIVIVGFCVGIYLQDLQHQKSTAHAWKANKHNLERFNKITSFNKSMSAANWQKMKDSIQGELDTLMILRFRKEVDSLTIANLETVQNLNTKKIAQ
ncbi:hypothetical protein JQC67_07405 [Aurantibacter crassamenti]|uniref:hypothetical protein n=1 Tax=Aurantibacter crassamenti TaxID=1837375 RepID=UPI001939A2AC|nr:hypothetical protein [Aurantibacter crassamenti]MBM1105956.1 hypothetical protein [Aurantibacter crassamenti]